MTDLLPPRVTFLPPSFGLASEWKTYSLSCLILDTQHTSKAGAKQCTGAGCQNAIFPCWSLVFLTHNDYNTFVLAPVSLVAG